MTIYSLDMLLFLFGTSLLFHVQFYLLLPDLHIGFSRGRSGGLVFPSLSEFSTVYCDPHSQSHAVWGHPKWLGHGGEVWQNVVHWRREYQSTLPVPWETYMQVKKQQWEPETEQWTGSKLRKEYVKAVYCNPAYLTYMQICHVKCWTGWIPKWNRDCP